MDSNDSEDGRDSGTAPAAPVAVKILIAGGFGVGKTTMVGTTSETTPVRTEEVLTHASTGVDDLSGVARKCTTTVALDFGRITVDPSLVVYLFGTPGQERFWFMWDDLVNGALGAVVLVDTRRLDISFASVDFFESRGIPFVVGVNCFDGRQERTEQEVREALALDPGVPLLLRDVRRRADCRDLLLALMDRLMERTVRAAATADAAAG
ncbi:ATP-binding protein [Streptomyces sulfonofaciens]|uniref:ATP-binding protein n=1 Tax=Streptomyces sulfonofaciens TaxID=68272 RepID=A0A919L1Z7_9ACTN|nr:ATP/GTP-binding protein [Streptomyces sulfonofaciens]GHH81955.1 ATP-binding protein [Streptomyces sulfonofaciens]